MVQLFDVKLLIFDKACRFRFWKKSTVNSGFEIQFFTNISQPNKKSEDTIVKEIFAPGPVKEFDDFDYKYDKQPKKSSSDKSSSPSDLTKNIQEPKARRRIQDRPSRPTQPRQVTLQNLLNREINTMTHCNKLLNGILAYGSICVIFLIECQEWFNIF